MARTGTPDLLPILRSKTQGAILTRLLLWPPRSWTVADVAAAVDADVWSARRELLRLERAGIVSRDTVGRTLVFSPEESSPLVQPLRTLLERSIGAEPLLAAALADVPGIDAALLVGSWARGDVRAPSDVDLLVVGEVDHVGLTDAVADVERRVGREIDLTAMTADEFRRRLAVGAGFLRDVLDRPYKLLLGELP